MVPQLAPARARCPTSRTAVRLASSVARLLARPRQGERVCVDGWVRSVRKQKRIAFAALGDGSTLSPLQVVLPPDLAKE